MARVTTEDCVESVPNRFELVIYACKRAREITSGSEIDIEKNNDKNTVVALREIAEKKVDLNELKDSIVKDLQRYTPVEEVDIEDVDSVPLKDNASEISFDNFEKENVYINTIDYYFSNSISRASKVMSECRDIKLKYQKSGTNN